MKRLRRFCLLMFILLVVGHHCVFVDDNLTIGLGVSTVRLLSAGLTESVEIDFPPYMTLAYMDEASTRAGVIFHNNGHVAGVLIADSTLVNDGFLQYVTAQIIPEDEPSIRTLCASWIQEHMKELQDGLIYAETWGQYYCCLTMEGSIRGCLIADVDMAANLIKALLDAGN